MNLKWLNFLLEQHTKKGVPSDQIRSYILSVEKGGRKFKSTPYKDPGGVWTIGYGTTIYPDGTRVVEDPSKIIDEETAKQYLNYGIDDAAKMVNFYVTKDLNQNQFDAMVSLVYNIGAKNLRDSNLLKKININPDDPSIKNEFLEFRKDSDGKILPGLEQRRKMEFDLYLTPMYQPPIQSFKQKKIEKTMAPKGKVINKQIKVKKK
jgi:lysozyme